MDTLDRSRGAVDRSAHGDDLAALEAVAHLHPDPAGFGAWLRRQLTDSGRSARADGVQLATVHRVKGLERKVAFVIGCNQGVLPHRRSLGYSRPDELPAPYPSSVADERCIMFVAVTRAKERLLLSSTEHYNNDVLEPSQFLREMELIVDEEAKTEESQDRFLDTPES